MKRLSECGMDIVVVMKYSGLSDPDFQGYKDFQDFGFTVPRMFCPVRKIPAELA